MCTHFLSPREDMPYTKLISCQDYVFQTPSLGDARLILGCVQDHRLCLFGNELKAHLQCNLSHVNLYKNHNISQFPIFYYVGTLQQHEWRFITLCDNHIGPWEFITKTHLQEFSQYQVWCMIHRNCQWRLQLKLWIVAAWKFDLAEILIQKWTWFKCAGDAERAFFGGAGVWSES